MDLKNKRVNSNGTINPTDMRYLTFATLLFNVAAYGQLTVDVVREKAVIKYHIGTYSYHEQFIGHKSYGAPLILTSDGGGAAFGSGDEGIMLVKLDKEGKEQLKRIIKPKGNETESQSVVQDKNGNYYLFMLTYDETKYRGGCERVVCLNKAGTILWDKFIGSCNLVNNPTVSYIRALSDGRIALRGHVVKETPPEGKDPTYYYWEGWLDKAGKLTQKTGPVIDWKKQEEWQSRLKPE
jgi:hypothetical protein